jgi:NAD(P)H-hydrate repair Nnr-like enzyme with NAD(P)H-hydrate dehydratase domain
MARLMGTETADLLDDPFKAMSQLSEQTGAVVVLKGALTVVGSAENEFFLNHHPNDGMATAGSGDILAGMIGGLLGQGCPPFAAARLGVFMHSLAGELAAETEGHRSMTAWDVIAQVGEAYRELERPSRKSFPAEARAELL